MIKLNIIYKNRRWVVKEQKLLTRIIKDIGFKPDKIKIKIEFKIDNIYRR